MNVITLSGNLCQDTEIRYSVSGKAILSNTIAVRKDKKIDGNYESDFIKIVAFEHNAEFLNKYAKKGDKIIVTGKMRADRYQDKEGNYKVDNYVIVDKLEILSSKKDDKVEFENTGRINITDDELPF